MGKFRENLLKEKRICICLVEREVGFFLKVRRENETEVFYVEKLVVWGEKSFEKTIQRATMNGRVVITIFIS